MNLKINLILIAFLLPVIKTFGQLQPQLPISMPSANASNLSVFSETPVSKYTGMPAIDVPIYTISDGNLSIPLGLSYHAGGVKPDAHPGWVGAGWSLQSGGVITRKINVFEDEINNSMWIGNYSLRLASDWSSFSAVKNYATTYIDAAPDEFSFSVNDISGSFYQDGNGAWQVKCDQDVKVVFSDSDFTQPFMTTPPPNAKGLTGYHRCFGKFTIITGDGTKYVFGGTNNAIDYSIDFFNQNTTEWTATSWYLTQIISIDGIHTINLTYERDQYTNVLFRNVYNNSYAISGTQLSSCSSNLGGIVTNSTVGGNLLSPVYLKSIETSKELIQFDRSTSTELRYNAAVYSSSYLSFTRAYTSSQSQQSAQSVNVMSGTGDTSVYKYLPLLRQNGLTAYPAILNNLQWKKLDKVSFKDKYTNIVIKQFNFNYTSDNTKRLTLTSLKESNPSGLSTDTISPYRFYYDVSNTLPDYLSDTTDEWGYYNGSVQTNFTAFRNANPQYAVSGTLRKIIYPTGGYKLFFFESNDYAAFANDDHTSITTGTNNLGGGLRIKSVYDYDPYAKSIKSKKYYYVKHFTAPNQANAVSSGIISSLPKHEWYYRGTMNANGYSLSATYNSRSSILPMSENASGSEIGYSEVAEVSQDNSYAISKFTNYDDGHLDEGTLTSLFPERGFMNAYTSLSIERGKPKYIGIYDVNSNLLKSTTISYQALHNNRAYVRIADARKDKLCNFDAAENEATGHFIFEGGAYKIYTYPYVPVSIIDSTFNNTGVPIVAVTNLYYDNPLNNLNTRVEQFRTDGQKMTTLTSYPQDYAAGTAFIDNMLSKGISILPIEKVNYLTDPATGNVKILSGTLTTYNTTNPFLKDTDYNIESAAPVSLANFKFSGAVKGSLPYNTSKLTFTNDPLYKSRASYQYDTYLNLTQVNTTDGVPSSTLWGYNNSLPVARTSNAKITEIYYNGFEEDVSGTSTDSKTGNKSKLLNGAAYALPTLTVLSSGRKYLVNFWYKNTGSNWAFYSNSYSTLPTSISGYTLIDEVRIYPENAQMKTMAYISPLGQPTFNNDITGRQVSYEYDGLQRLKLTRDDNKNILQDHVYNVSPVTAITENFYYSILKTGSYQRANCTAGTGTYITYAVSAGSYISSISQQDADTQAQNEVTAKGQAAANLLGKCLFYNSARSSTYYRSNCAAPQTAAPYVVSVAQGKYNSEVSQADADAKAQNEIDTKGALVDVNGTCTTPAATITVENYLNAVVSQRTLTITLTNTVSGVQYTSGALRENHTMNFTVPPGSYSISYSADTYQSLRLDKNSSFVECKGNGGLPGAFANISIVNNDYLKFTMSDNTCPAPN